MAINDFLMNIHRVRKKEATVLISV